MPRGRSCIAQVSGVKHTGSLLSRAFDRNLELVVRKCLAAKHNTLGCDLCRCTVARSWSTAGKDRWQQSHLFCGSYR